MERLRGNVDSRTKKTLVELTNEFYASVADSFSETRSAPWQGWSRVVDCVTDTLGKEPGAREEVALERAVCSVQESSVQESELGVASASARPLRVLDIGCGNLRFEKYLSARGVPFEATCVDNCEALMREGLGDVSPTSGAVHLVQADVMQPLMDGLDVKMGLGLLPDSFDVAVAFGFLHHIPESDCRERLVKSLGSLIRPGGLVAVSFWQFERDDRILAKAQATTEVARSTFALETLEKGDYLLGWQRDESVFRYCHSFSEEEISDLSERLSPDVREVLRFSADGKSGDLNRYVIWEKPLVV